MSRGRPQNGQPPSGATSTKNGATYFRTGLPSANGESNSQISVWLAPGNPAVRGGITRDKFDPLYFYRHRDEEIAERFLFFHKLAKTEDLTTVFVERQGSLVILELRHPGLLNRYEADLNCGGNLVRYFADEDTSVNAGTEEHRYEYEQVEGVWVPKLITESMATPKRGSKTSRVTRFSNKKANAPASSEAFSLQAVGAEPGELVLDNRAGVTYQYGAPESKERAQPAPSLWLWLASVALLTVVALYVLARGRRAR